MALNEAQKKNLEQLDIINGSGILKDNRRVSSVNSPTVIISLGGLGGKTLNKLKDQMIRRINPEGNCVRLLAIDSSEKDIRELKNNGNIQDDEAFCLYKPEVANGGIPYHVEQWINKEHTPHITGAGCGGKRQNGRYVLSVNSVYNNVRAKIASVISAAKATAPTQQVNIIFIAGISGGTGSGTFIDMAYLVQDIMSVEIAIGTRANYKMSAYLYMPDVQFGIGATDASLMRNGYAALKELDYFYNIDIVGGKYHWPFSEGSIKNSTERIYDFCTLVSSVNQHGAVGDREGQAINVTVESLMSIITDGQISQDDGQTVQVLSSFLDNHDNNVTSWQLTNNVLQNQKLFPLSANYRYNIIGYGSAKFPIDAIMSYIAFHAYEAVLDDYKNINMLNSQFINQVLAGASISDMETLLDKVKSEVQYGYGSRQLPSGKEIKKLGKDYKVWRDKMTAHYKDIVRSAEFQNGMDRVVADIVKSLDQSLSNAFSNYGPYFVVKSITATVVEDQCDGILKKIKGLIGALEVEKAKVSRNNREDIILDQLDSDAKDIPSIPLIGPSENDRDHYVRTSKQYVEDCMVKPKVVEILIDKLCDVADHMIDQNNQVFNVYTEVLEHVKSTLEKNSDLVVNTSMNAKRDRFSLEVINLDAASANGLRLKQCVDSFITPDFVNDFKRDFKSLLEDPSCRPAFTNDNMDQFNATDKLKELFDDKLSDLYQESLERFLIVYYTSDPALNNYTNLNIVMKDPKQKTQLLREAAMKVLDGLNATAQPMCGIIGGSLENFATPQRYICCPTSLYSVFAQEASNVYPGVIVCKRDKGVSVDMVTNHIGIPLTRIQGINDADIEYTRQIEANVQGIHLNESKESDFQMLPAPFVREVWYLAGEHTSSVEVLNYKKVDQLIEEVDALGLWNTDTVGAVCVRSYFTTEVGGILESFATEADNLVDEDTDVVGFIENYLTKLGGVYTVCNWKLPSGSAVPNNKGNLHVIIRKNIELYRVLTKFVANYKQLSQIVLEKKDKCTQHTTYQVDLGVFGKYIKAGLITYDAQKSEWRYYNGDMEVKLYNFIIAGKYEKAYNLFFAYVSYITTVNATEKADMDDLVDERVENGTFESEFPQSILGGVKALYRSGETENSKQWVLDRQANIETINRNSVKHKEEFSIPLPQGQDYWEILKKFYADFTNL